MALEKFGAELFALARDEGCPLNRVLTLGKQNFFLFESEIPAVEKACGFTVSDLIARRSDEELADPFIERLGAKHVESMDISAYQGCSVVHDLNQPISTDLKGRYDLVFDGGTLEHVFNFPTAIKNCMHLVNEGGWFLTCTPSNNFNGHGFYQFSPELFYRVFAEENGFQVRAMALGEACPPGRIYRVPDPDIAGKRLAKNSGPPQMLIMAARRTRIVTDLLKKPPFQSDYVSAWTGQRESDNPAGSGGNVLGKVTRKLPAGLRDRIRTRLTAARRRRKDSDQLERVSTLRDCLIA